MAGRVHLKDGVRVSPVVKVTPEQEPKGIRHWTLPEGVPGEGAERCGGAQEGNVAGWGRWAETDHIRSRWVWRRWRRLGVTPSEMGPVGGLGARCMWSDGGLKRSPGCCVRTASGQGESWGLVTGRSWSSGYRG